MLSWKYLAADIPTGAAAARENLRQFFSADSIKRSVCQESDPNAIFLHLLQCHGCSLGQDLGRAGVNKIQVTQYQVWLMMQNVFCDKMVWGLTLDRLAGPSSTSLITTWLARLSPCHDATQQTQKSCRAENLVVSWGLSIKYNREYHALLHLSWIKMRSCTLKFGHD